MHQFTAGENPVEPAPIQARPVTLSPGLPTRPLNPLELPWLSRRNAWMDLVLLILVALVAPMGVQVFAAAWTDLPAIAEGDLDILIVSKWFDLLLAVGLVFYLVVRGRIPAASFGVRANDWPRQLGWGLLCLIATYGWVAITLALIIVLYTIWPGLEADLKGREKMLELMPKDDVFRLLVLMIPVALHEEIIFRGLLLTYLRRLFRSWWLAVLATAGIFAVLHFNQGVIGVLQVFGLGVIFAVVFIWSRSLLAVAAAHFAFNTLQLLVAGFMQKFIEEYGGGM